MHSIQIITTIPMIAYRITAKQCGSYKCKQFENIQQKYYSNMIHKDAGFSLDKDASWCGTVREANVWSEPVADLELVNHGGHAHLVLLREAIQVSEHALVPWWLPLPPPPREEES
jgi:hypothetical protein